MRADRRRAAGRDFGRPAISQSAVIVTALVVAPVLTILILLIIF